MKGTLLIMLLLISTNIFAQIKMDSISGKSLGKELIGLKLSDRKIHTEADTIPIIGRQTSSENENTILWYLNGKLIDEQCLTTINPKQIEELKVEKASTKSNPGNYLNEIYVKTKDGFNPTWISLNELKLKYLDLPEKTSTLFMINDNFIKDDYDTYLVNEKYILKIDVEVIQNIKEGLDIRVVKLLTRSEKNLKKINTIRLKGTVQNEIN